MTHRPILLGDWNTLRSNISSALIFGIAALSLVLWGCSGNEFAAVSMTGATTPAVNEPPAATPRSLTFAQVTATPSTQTVDVVSQGSDPITATIASGSDFRLTSASCTTGAATCHIAVTFSPVQPEIVSGTLLLTDTVTGLATIVPLSGTSLLPTAAPTASPATLTFVASLVGSSTPWQIVAVSSPSQDSVSALLTTGSSSFLIPQATSCAVGASVCQIAVAAQPLQSGIFAGLLVITDTLTGLFTTVKLSGTAIAPPLPTPLPPKLTPAALLFSDVQLGSVSMLQALIGTQPDPLEFEITGSQFNLVPGTSCASSAISCSIGITFTPASLGSATGSLKVTDKVTGLFAIATLTGNGIAVPAPVITLSPASISAAPTIIGSTTASQPISLTNTGDAPLTISAVVLSGINAGDFSETNTCAGLVVANSACSLSVSFTPLAFGVRTAVLQLVTNASSTPAALQLSGTGTPNPAKVLVPGANSYIPFMEGAGSVARDVSGNGNDCTFGIGTNAPYWINHGLQLNDNTDANQKFCSLPASSSNNDLSVMNSRTLTMCAYFNPQIAPFGYYYTSAFGGSDRDHIAALWLSGPAHGRAAYYMGDYFGQGGEPTWSTEPLVGYRCVTYALGSTTDGTVDHLYIDGAEVTSYGAQGTLWDLRAPGDFYQVGALPWAGGGYLWGTLYTVLTYPTQLTAVSVAHNFSVLQQSAFFSRGVGALPVQSTTSANVLVVNGDSLTNDSPYGVTPYPFLLNTTTPFTVTDTGVAGKTVESTVADFSLIDLPLYSPNSQYAFVSDAAGINDINIGGSSQAEIVADRATLYASYKQTGFTVLAPTMLSSINNDIEVEGINAGLRTLASTMGYYLVDWANEPCLGAAGSFANPAGCGFFQSDGLHLTQAGENELAALYSNTVNYLTASLQSHPTVVTAAAYTLTPADRFLSAQGAASQTLFLPSCYGWSTTTPFLITNANAVGTLSLAPSSGFMLNGGVMPIPIPASASILAYADILSSTSSGCGWFTR